MSTVVVYCHFSFRRPKGKDYGIFSTAFYTDSNGKNLIARRVRAYKLWEDHQHVTAIQAYANALNVIYELQGKMLEHKVTNILLVTDNSNLVTWILSPKRNKRFAPYMNKAYAPFHSGAKELLISIGLCRPRKLEKSHKYCKEELVDNWSSFKKSNNTSSRTKLHIEGLSSLEDILSEDVPTGLDSLEPVSADELEKEFE